MPTRSPTIPQRPFESDVEITCRGPTSGLNARIVAPLIGFPALSRTDPAARAVCAEAGAASQRALMTATMIRRRLTTGEYLNSQLPTPNFQTRGPRPRLVRASIWELGVGNWEFSKG